MPATGLPVLRARLVPEARAEGLAGVRVLAFAGIGRPEKFFATLLSLRAQVVKAHAFADHHAYAPDEVMSLIEEAHRLGAIPITTEKDAVRLSAEARTMVQTLSVALELESPPALEALLDRV
jgi:tetraacyldisaccharide 4'-kinase